MSTLLDNVYEDHPDTSDDFGPRVHDGPTRRRNAGRHAFPPNRGDSPTSSARRSETPTTLIAHLTSHTASITGICVSPDHAFFVTCSSDKTVKVWDTARLERNVTSKPRHSYTQHHARVTAVCMLEGTHCFASAAEDGSVHVVRVHVVSGGAVPKYGKLSVVREHRVDQAGEFVTCLAHYNLGMLPSDANPA